MKPPASLPRLVRLFALCLATSIGDAGQWCRGATDASTDGTHFLFMGTDLSVEWKKEFYPVSGVRGDSLVIRAGKRDVAVPLDRGDINIRVSQSLRLTRTTATVDDFTSARAYTPARDPERRLRERVSTSFALANLSDDADRAARDAAMQADFANTTGSMGASPGMEQKVDTTAAAAQQMEIARLSDGDLADRVADADAELSRNLFDALEVSCDIHAKRPLRDPYLIIIARYQEPGAKPGMVREWIHAETIKDVSERSARVRIKHGGFPPGFQLQDVRMHVYEQGHEVATNLSRRRVTLTAEETFKYLLIEYRTGNRDATLTARPVPELWPASAISALNLEQASHVYYVAVGQDGLPQGSFLDAAGSTKTEAQIADLMDQIRFYPALNDGEATDSVIPVRLDSLPKAE